MHICVLSACVSSDLRRVRLEVEVQGHYLQPQRAASASSLPPGSLPASDLRRKKPARAFLEIHSRVRYRRRHTRVLMTFSQRRREANSMLAGGTSRLLSVALIFYSEYAQIHFKLQNCTSIIFPDVSFHPADNLSTQSPACHQKQPRI